MTWGKRLVTAPDPGADHNFGLPVTLEQLKRRAQLPLNTAYHDPELLDAARAAVDWIQRTKGRQFSPATWDYSTGYVTRSIMLPVNPVIEVTDVNYLDTEGQRRGIAAEDYRLISDREPALLVPEHNQAWPATGRAPDAFVVRFRAGYDGIAHHLPPLAEQAILQTAAHWFIHKLPVSLGSNPAEIPLALQAALDSLTYGDEFAEYG